MPNRTGRRELKYQIRGPVFSSIGEKRLSKGPQAECWSNFYFEHLIKFCIRNSRVRPGFKLKLIADRCARHPLLEDGLALFVTKRPQLRESASPKPGQHSSASRQALSSSQSFAHPAWDGLFARFG